MLFILIDIRSVECKKLSIYPMKPMKYSFYLLHYKTFTSHSLSISTFFSFIFVKIFSFMAWFNTNLPLADDKKILRLRFYPFFFRMALFIFLISAFFTILGLSWFNTISLELWLWISLTERKNCKFYFIVHW